MKQKTKKAIVKRFKLTKTGKLLRRRQNSRHLRSNKSASQKRRHKRITLVNSTFTKKLKKLINQ